MSSHSAYGRDVQSLDVALINDKQGLLKILRPILTGFGVARVRTYGDPHRALRSLLEEPPDLILANERMKPLDGSRLVRMLRHRDMSPLCFAPVVVLSGWARRSTVEQAFLAGAHQVLVLPVSPTLLYRRIEWLLGDRREMLLKGQHYVIEGVEEMLAASRAPQKPGWDDAKRETEDDPPRMVPSGSCLPESSGDVTDGIWEV